MHRLPVRLRGALLAFLAGLLMQWGPLCGAGESDVLLLKPSLDLALVPAARAEIQPPIPDEGLALRSGREIAGRLPERPSADSPQAAAGAPRHPDFQFQLLTGFALFLFATIVALLITSLVARWSRETAEGREARFRKRWEPVLYGRMAGDPVLLPPLARNERVLLLKLWLHVLGYVRDEAIDAMADVAKELEFSRLALHLLESGAPQERLIAMRVVAALRLKEAIAPLQEKVEQARPHSSLEAANALLQISPEHGFAALRKLLTLVDWAPGALVAMLKTGGQGATGMLADLLATLPQGAGAPVLRLLALLDDYAAVPVLRERLRGNADDQEISVILHALGKLGGAAERTAAIEFLDHPGWLVRMQAASALGEVGLPEDWERLRPLLEDSHWWVRYRAAQSLLKLGGPDAVRRARAESSDRYAIDMLHRVQAE